ncbi:MAG: alpha/beta hydrolase [Gammaproteobacteria bacterium]|nr:alpha/beta hydrolase [Gammaproteobacteria bacterium]NNJ50722.1 alpha/beta hydrolase [Gammaproteobacteria bacterium]
MSIQGKYFLLILPLFLLSSMLHAETVSLETSKNVTATAEYISGEPGKPLLILIHGFLQTRSFSTVDRLFTALQDSGFPVLAPTLSLGISERAQALPCESIHTHSLGDDSREIGQWVDWASKQGHEDIVLIGHSAGSVNITAYLATGSHPVVKKTILISLTHYGPGRPAALETEEHARLARTMIEQGDDGLERFALAFCKDYVSTAKNFLSYYDWSDQAIIKAINKKAPENYIIIGSNDNRIKQQWISSLQQANAKVIVIDGASHFFDQAYEFDLLEKVEELLEPE